MRQMMASLAGPAPVLGPVRTSQRPQRAAVKVRAAAQLQARGLPEVSTLDAWYMDDKNDDQRFEHRKSPNEEASAKLQELGVLSWKIDADNFETDSDLSAIREDRGYDWDDIIDISPDKIPGYEEKIVKFFGEHLHAAEEIRLVLEGSGYFDVRDTEDKWIRIDTRKGDMIILPEGIFHRITLDSKKLFKAMRFFKGPPDWTNFIRPEDTDNHASREKYVQLYGAS